MKLMGPPFSHAEMAAEVKLMSYQYPPFSLAEMSALKLVNPYPPRPLKLMSHQCLPFLHAEMAALKLMRHQYPPFSHADMTALKLTYAICFEVSHPQSDADMQKMSTEKMAALKQIGYHHPAFSHAEIAALKLTLIGSEVSPSHCPPFVHAKVHLPFSHAEMLTLIGSEDSPSHCLRIVHAKVQLHAKLAQAPSRVLADMRALYSSLYRTNCIIQTNDMNM